MRCIKCNSEIPEDAETCAVCGIPVMRVRPTPAISWELPLASVPSQAPPGAAAPVAVRLLYAGFWLRALAYALDTIVLGLVAAPILFILLPHGAQLWEEYSKLPPTELFNMSSPVARSVMVVTLPVVLTVGWLYYALCESSSWQGTLGKKLLGLTVTDLDGRPVTFGRASARFFGKILTGLVPFALGYVMAGFTRRKQALHDMIARCLVLRR